MPRPPLPVQWEAQPWGQFNTAQLARMLGVAETTVASYRAYYAPETITAPGRPPVDLSRADFTMRDTEIARAHGCHPDVVREWRRTHTVPACTRPRGGNSSGRPRVYDREKFDPRRSVKENQYAMGCSHQLAWLMMKEHREKQMKKGQTA